MLETYRKHVAERAAEGVVAKPLDAEQVAALVELLPQVEALSMDVREMPRETFINRSQYLEESGRPM